MKRSVRFGVATLALVAVFAMAKASQAQSWGFYVNGPRGSFGATSFGYSGYGGGYGGGYGCQPSYAYRGFVGCNPRPAFRCVPQPYCPPPPCFGPPAYYGGHHRHGHGRGW